jgi:hypothetical protein
MKAGRIGGMVFSFLYLAFRAWWRTCSEAARAFPLRPAQPREPPPTPIATVGDVRRRDRLGGLIHEYNPTAA